MGQGRERGANVHYFDLKYVEKARGVEPQNGVCVAGAQDRETSCKYLPERRRRRPYAKGVPSVTCGQGFPPRRGGRRGPGDRTPPARTPGGPEGQEWET